MRFHFLAAVATLGILALTTLPQKAHAFELVTNGGFETGNFSGWTLSGNTGFTSVGGAPHSGTFAASFGPIGSTGILSQSLSTSIGQSYLFSFWLRNDFGPTNSFAARWDGNNLLNLGNSAPFGYTQFSYTGVATSTSTLIEFEYRHDPSFWRLDNVSATALTPEMPAGVLALFALAPVGFIAMKRRNS